MVIASIGKSATSALHPYFLLHLDLHQHHHRGLAHFQSEQHLYRISDIILSLHFRTSDSGKHQVTELQV